MNYIGQNMGYTTFLINSWLWNRLPKVLPHRNSLIRTYEPNLGDSWTESKELVSKLCKTSYATGVLKAQNLRWILTTTLWKTVVTKSQFYFEPWSNRGLLNEIILYDSYCFRQQMDKSKILVSYSSKVVESFWHKLEVVRDRSRRLRHTSILSSKIMTEFQPKIE